ncbi:MAG: hypothetical protein Q7K55_01240 [Candidatus Levybacteria bacterium]|nr:hypothetical protein [Candidatus Levybacteria bacterium]
MTNFFKDHIVYYLSLFLILVLGLYLALRVFQDKRLQIYVIAGTVFLYVFWGIFHHYINHDLNRKIVVEYILMGALGLSILLFFVRL